MSIYQNDVYRIRRNAEYQDEMKQLMQSGVFSNYYTILSVSALVGYYHNAYVPFEKTAERVSLTSFTANDKDLIDLIAVGLVRVVLLLFRFLAFARATGGLPPVSARRGVGGGGGGGGPGWGGCGSGGAVCGAAHRPQAQTLVTRSTNLIYVKRWRQKR